MLPLFDEQKNAAPAPLIDVKAAFAQLWAEWPRKVGKDAAERKFYQTIAKPGVTIQMLMDALAWQRYLPQWMIVKNGVRIYVPHLATWLHQGRYKDPRPEGFRTPQDTRRKVVPVTPEQAQRMRELRADIDHQRHLDNMERITSGSIYREFPNLPPGSMKVRPCECWNCMKARGEI